MSIGVQFLLKEFSKSAFTRYYRGNPDLHEALNLGYVEEIPRSKHRSTSLFKLTSAGRTALSQT